MNCTKAAEEDGQTITKLSGCNIKLMLMNALLLPSLIFQFFKLMGREETFFNSMNSLFGRPIEGEGSGNSSSITISNLFAVCAANGHGNNVVTRKMTHTFLIMNSC
jgi:hypothetical protein